MGVSRSIHRSSETRGEPPPIALDLFSGAGGLTLGLRRAGFKVIGAIDNDILAVDTYRANHPKVTVWPSRIETISTREVKRALRLRKGQLDLLAGCPPCQGFSALRTRNGSRPVDDERNDLILEFLRFVRDLRPKTIMLENVPALASDYRFRHVCSEFAGLGYFVQYTIADAADFGVPQRRRRLIMLASRIGPVSLPSVSTTARTVKGAIFRLPTAGSSGDPLHDFPERRSQKVQRLIRRIPKNGGSRAALGRKSQLPCHQVTDGFKDIYGRMSWRGVAPTITSGCTNPSKGRFLHPEEDRAITLREAAILQGFPRKYVFSLTRGKSGAATLIGNALPPNFVKHHAIVLWKLVVGERRASS